MHARFKRDFTHGSAVKYWSFEFSFKIAKYNSFFFFDQVSYFFKKINEVSLLAVFFFLPCVVFDVQSYSTKGFSTRSRAPVWNTNYITALFMII